MSRAWMPLYVGDYLRDTGHLNTAQHGAYLLLIMHYWQHGGLPKSESELAAIARVPIRKWRVLSVPIKVLFDDDWTHRRVDKELAKTDRAIMQRRLAGRVGGIKSGLSRAITRSEMEADLAARRKRSAKRPLAMSEAADPAPTKPPGTNQNLSMKTLSASANELTAEARRGDVPRDAAGLSPSPELERIIRRKSQS
jgi:uncharacterized protein YdaU (DUF1376 family)